MRIFCECCNESEAQEKGPQAIAMLCKQMGLDEDEVLKAIAGGRRVSVQKKASSEGFRHGFLEEAEGKISVRVGEALSRIEEIILKRIKEKVDGTI